MLEFPQVEYVDGWMKGESALELCRFFKGEAEFDGEDTLVWDILEQEVLDTLANEASPLVSILLIEGRLEKYLKARSSNH